MSEWTVVEALEPMAFFFLLKRGLWQKLGSREQIKRTGPKNVEEKKKRSTRCTIQYTYQALHSHCTWSKSKWPNNNFHNVVSHVGETPNMLACSPRIHTMVVSSQPRPSCLAWESPLHRVDTLISIRTQDSRMSFNRCSI